jgi:ABC transporter, ATP-binding protein
LILVLQNGQIIERGRHEDLLALDGWYAQTYQSQQLEMKGEEDAE